MRYVNVVRCLLCPPAGAWAHQCTLVQVSVQYECARLRALSHRIVWFWTNFSGIIVERCLIMQCS